MVDICKCDNDDCVKARDCYRYTAPNGIWQAYSTFEPDNNTQEGFSCEMIIVIEEDM
jgi:hypothetical protein